MTAAWTAATADGTVSHLSPKFREMLSLVYPLIAKYPGDVGNEQALWMVVRLAQESPGPISETLLADISTSLARVRHVAWLNDAVAQQSLDQLLNAGVKPNYLIPLDEGATRADLIRFLQANKTCEPLLVDGKPLPAR